MKLYIGFLVLAVAYTMVNGNCLTDTDKITACGQKIISQFGKFNKKEIDKLQYTQDELKDICKNNDGVSSCITDYIEKCASSIGSLLPAEVLQKAKDLQSKFGNVDGLCANAKVVEKYGEIASCMKKTNQTEFTEACKKELEPIMEDLNKQMGNMGAALAGGVQATPGTITVNVRQTRNVMENPAAKKVQCCMGIKLSNCLINKVEDKCGEEAGTFFKTTSGSVVDMNEKCKEFLAECSMANPLSSGTLMVLMSALVAILLSKY